MASNVLVHEIPDSLLGCPICRQSYVKPKALSCLHSFCEDCIRDYIASRYENLEHFLCPVCRQVNNNTYTSTDSPSTFTLSSNRAFEFIYRFLRYHLCSPCLVMGSVLLIFLVLCVVFVFFFFLVPNVAHVVVLSILDCTFGFL